MLKPALIWIYVLYSSLIISAESLKVGVSPIMSSSAIYIAQEKGYFQKYGLGQVELIPFRNSGAPMTVLLANGEIDIGGGNINSGLLNAINSGISIKVVADKGHVGKDTSYISLLVRNDHISSGRYKGTEDLKGFKLGFTSEVGVSQQILLDKVLKKSNLKLSDVEFVKLTYPEMNIALKNKSIDATIQLEPYVTMAVKSGIAKKVETAYSFYPNQQSAGIFYSPKMIKEKKDIGVKFMAAYLNGIEDYNTAFLENKNKKEIISILKKYITIDDDEVWNSVTPVGLAANGAIELESLKSDIEWYKLNKFTEKSPSVQDVFDEYFLVEAKKLLSGKK